MTTPRPIAALLAAPWFALLARILLTLPYWSSGVSKLLDPAGALAEARHFGLEPAILTMAATVIVQLGGSLLLIFGRWSWGWIAAGALGVFTALATLIGHPFWTIADPVARFHEQNTFLEHIGLIGGFMLAAALAARPAEPKR
jgi:uncharacterized membrane protein YphA (DoxX/SURF4 family)